MNLKTKKLMAVMVLVVVLSLVTLQSGRAFLTWQSQAQPGTIAAYLEEAQVNNQNSITFPAGIHEYFRPDTWDGVISGFSFLIAEPIEVRSFGTLTDDTIKSWYRFRIIETLATKPPPFAITDPPGGMAPPQTNELLVFKWGGTVTLNGIQVTAEEPSFPDLIIGQRYLLIVQVDPSTRLANNAMGSDGAYTISASGQILPVNPEGGVFQNDLATRYSSSIDQLRAALAP